MKAYYIFDTYCGWCYGFEKILKSFADLHPELEIKVISGGLFIEGYPLSAYPHIPQANKRISETFGVEFGKQYQQVLEDGRMVPNSNDAAIAFSVLRDRLPVSEHVNLSVKILEAFYVYGKSLSDVETIKDIAVEFGILDNEVANEYEINKNKGELHQDFKEAKTLGVTSFPTLLLEVDGKVLDLKGNATTLEELENNMKSAVEFK